MAKGPHHVSDNDLASTKRVDLVFQLESGTTLEDALKPEFWAHIAGKRYFKPFTRVELQAADPVKFLADTVVIAAGPGFVKLKLLAYHDLADSEVAEQAEGLDDDRFLIKHSGFGKWAVIRKSDSKELKGGFQTKEDAQLFALNHQRLVTA